MQPEAFTVLERQLQSTPQTVVVDPKWASSQDALAEAMDTSIRALRSLLSRTLDGEGAENESSPSSAALIGVDMEWSNPKRHKHVQNLSSCTPSSTAVAVLQIALNVSGECGVEVLVIKVCDVVSWALALDCDKDPSMRLRCVSLLDAISDVFASTKVIKCGVGILSDRKRLQNDYAHTPWFSAMPSCLELGTCEQNLMQCGLLSVVDDPNQPVAADAAEGDNTVGRRATGQSLKDFAQRYANMILEKDIAVVTSDWGTQTKPLSPAQIRYAANDALSSLQAATGMLHRCCQQQQQQQQEGDQSNNYSRRIEDLESILQLSLDVAAPTAAKKGGGVGKGNTTAGADAISNSNAATEVPAVSAHATAMQALEEKRVANAQRVFECRKEAYYDNIEVFDPDGRLLFTVDKRKAEWYVHKKSLAKVLRLRHSVDVSTTTTSAAIRGEDMAAIQLNFYPDLGRYNDGHIRRDLDYYRQPKENRCVVCGKPDTVVRTAVVPLMYRKYFPAAYVSHNSYDLLLLCPPCFAKLNLHHDVERKRIAEEFGFPLAMNRRQTRSKGHHDGRSSSTTSPSRLPPTNDCGNATDGNEGQTVFEVTRGARVVIHQMIKNACALHRCHVATGRIAATTTTTASTTTTATQEDDNGDASQSSTQTPTPPTHRHEKQKQRCIAAAGWIPEDRYDALMQYIRTHAHRYDLPLPSRRALSMDAAGSDAEWYTQPDVIAEIAALDLHSAVSSYVARRFPQLAATAAMSTAVERHMAGGSAATTDDSGDSTSLLARVSIQRHPTLAADATLPNGSTIPAVALATVIPVDNHAAFVVSSLVNRYEGHPDYGVGEFIRRWRQLFIDVMKPKYLPKGWIVDEGILLPPPSCCGHVE